MNCPYCAHPDSKVINSRSNQNGHAVRRRRACQACERRFTTYEHVEHIPIQVVKKDGKREPFDRDKILRGLQVACRKRDVPFDSIERVVTYVEKEVQNSIDKEIHSPAIGEMVLKRLKDIDGVAYVRFASVYRDFRDIAEFSEEVLALIKQGR